MTNERQYSFVAKTSDNTKDVYVDDDLLPDEEVPTYFFARYLLCLASEGSAYMKRGDEEIVPTYQQLQAGFEWYVEYLRDECHDVEYDAFVNQAGYLLQMQKALNNSPSNLEEVARELVMQKYDGRGYILAVGELQPDGSDETPIGGHTIVIDLGGQGMDIRVVEVVFYFGHGITSEIACTHGDAPVDVKDFNFNLIASQV